MSFFEKMFKAPAPKAEKPKDEPTSEAVEAAEEIKPQAETAAEGTANENKEAKQEEGENAGAENAGEAKEQGPAAFEMSPSFSKALSKLVEASSSSPLDLEMAMSRLDDAISADCKGKKFANSEASDKVLSSISKAVKNCNNNFFLGMKKQTYMIRIGDMETKFCRSLE